MNLNDNTKVAVKSLVPAVYYSCTTTFESFAWVEVGDVQEMTYKQLKIMRMKHPRYFTEEWLIPCNNEVIEKLNLSEFYKQKPNRSDIKMLYGDDIEAVEKMINSFSNSAMDEFAKRVVKVAQAGQITNVKIIRLLEKKLGVELMQYV